jgi:acyl-coenzyme A synthetase/AMP-(fatty) acid ligase/thioesterase domain-containing protein/acyl carrier protein
MTNEMTAPDPHAVTSIPSAVAAQISRRSGHVALRQGQRTLTYQQLGHAVGAGMARLTELGITSATIDTVAGTRVTADITTASPPIIVIAPLGIEGTVLQLAVLFSGRVCAPLETTLGGESLARIIDFIGGPVICLDPTTISLLSAVGLHCEDTTSLRLDALLNAPPTVLTVPNAADEPDPSTASATATATADNAALLCFTSGSTGTPKGVLVSHLMLIEAARFAGTSDADVVAITSPPSFFASMLQTMLALAVGGTGTYLDLTANTPAQLHDIAIDHGLNHFTGTTTHVRELARASLDEPISSLWGIDLGGEPITRVDVELFRRTFPAARIRNIYGSAETSRVTSLDVAPDDVLPPPGPLAAGRPSTGRIVAVFDDQDRPVATNEPGRIALQRPEQFLGYWRNPELTATRLLTTADGRSWILTGDIGRLDQQGILTVLGRSDDQVKIRGRFVNPREIDTLLLADPRIRSAITIAFPPEAPTHLRTIVVPTDPEEPTTTQPALRHMLAQTLPLHALPRHIIFVDHIPVTTRGKPDMTALATIDPPSKAGDDEAPSEDASAIRGTVLDTSLLHSIRELLELRVDRTDDIFAMGADSLLAVELIETIVEEFGIRISPAQLVANPTAAKLSELLRNGIADDTHPGLTTLFDSDNPTTAFWVLGADESFGPARLAQLTAPIRSFCTKVIGATPPERLLPSITAIGEANADAIEPVRSANTVIVGYSVGTVIALETACALARRGTPPDLLVLIDPPTAENLGIFSRAHTLPSPLRHPKWFLHLWRKRNRELHHPFDTSDPLELVTRIVNRHTRLLLDHTMTPYAGPTTLIQSQEFVDAGGTPVVLAGLVSPPPALLIGGTHGEVLVEPAGLTTVILTLLEQHGLLAEG